MFPLALIRRLLFTALCLGSLAQHSTLPAQPADSPLENFVSMNGYVYAIAESDDILYLGGNFTDIGLRSGGGVPVDLTTGQPAEGYPHINGFVGAVAADGQGGWFVGGSFTRVGAFSRQGLVHLGADLKVDASWNPSVPNGTVGAAFLHNGVLFIGGSFTNVNGQVRSNLAALNATTGELLPWNPTANGRVLDLEVFGDNVYICGEFRSVNNQTRDYAAALHRDTGALQTWNPAPNDNIEVMALAGDKLYAGGRFASISGQQRLGLAAYNLPGGQLTSWNPGTGSATIVSSLVWEMLVHEGTVYVGGVFTSIGNKTRINVAAIDAESGAVLDFDAQADLGLSSGFPTAQVNSLAVAGDQLIIGGLLFRIGGQDRFALAAVDRVTGQVLDWNPNANGPAQAALVQGNTVFVGGLFSSLNMLPRKNLAAYDKASGQITAWNPGADGDVNALAVAGDKVFIGGRFTEVGGLIRSNLASAHKISGEVNEWAPKADLLVNSIVTHGDKVYAAGSFRFVADLPRTNIVELDMDFGIPTDWDFQMNRATVLALAISGHTLYAGGLITTAGGQPRSRLAAFDLANRTLSDWKVTFGSGANNVEAIAISGDSVYIGGRFASINGSPRTNAAAISASTGELLPWSPNPDRPVYGIAATPDLVVIAGEFTQVGSQNRQHLVATDAATGALTDWSPNPDFLLRKAFIADNTLYVGGFFFELASEVTRGIAAFPLPTSTPTIQFAQPSIANGQFRFQITGNASSATLQWSSDLTSWNDLGNITLINGTADQSEPFTPSAPPRFYRLTLP
jgi:hypothetical protein